MNDIDPEGESEISLSSVERETCLERTQIEDLYIMDSFANVFEFYPRLTSDHSIEDHQSLSPIAKTNSVRPKFSSLINISGSCFLAKLCSEFGSAWFVCWPLLGVLYQTSLFDILFKFYASIGFVFFFSFRQDLCHVSISLFSLH